MDEETSQQPMIARTTSTTLAQLKPPPVDLSTMPAVSMGFGSLQSFELMQRAAKLLVGSTLLPQAYQGNIPNCVIALNMALRLNADPLMVMQNLNIIAGRPSWSSQFLIACWNQCGRFTSMKYRFIGERGKDTYGCIAHAKEYATREIVEGPDVTVSMAKEQGWYTRNGSKWPSMTQTMLMYRAAAFLVRTHAPDLTMGLPTVEEAHDIYDARAGADGTYTVQQTTEPPARASSAPPSSAASSAPSAAPPPPLSEDVIRAERADRAERARNRAATTTTEEGNKLL